jgi:DNA-binding LacI/PurR family transcriptional regulator
VESVTPRNYSLTAVNSDDNTAREKDLLTLLRSQRVDGILLVVAAGTVPAERASEIRNPDVSLVHLDRIPEGAQADSVSVDNAAADLGVTRLISIGHRRIAIVTGSLSLRNEQDRLQEYERALSEPVSADRTSWFGKEIFERKTLLRFVASCSVIRGTVRQLSSHPTAPPDWAFCARSLHIRDPCAEEYIA